MNNNGNRLYFKVGSNVVSVPKEDMVNRTIDCASVEVLMWTEQEPFYKFEHNDLAQHIAENENLECFVGLETPDSLIDQEIIEILKKKAKNNEQDKTVFVYTGVTTRGLGRGIISNVGHGVMGRLRYMPPNYLEDVEERLSVGGKGKKTPGKIRVGVK